MNHALPGHGWTLRQRNTLVIAPAKGWAMEDCSQFTENGPSQPWLRPLPWPNRCAYTLLELMLALSLLSVLMLLGWSLLNTFQDAEKRSWKLTQRVRVLRLTRTWLSSDMDHLVRTSASTGADATTPSITMRFDGDTMGFKATIQPSMDPVLFFDKLVSKGSDAEVNPMDAMLATDEERRVIEWQQSMWPAESIDVEYRFETIADDTRSIDSALPFADSDDAQYELVRREWLPPLPDSKLARNENRLSPIQGAVEPSDASNRTLSMGDLYRVEEDTSVDLSPPLREAKLYGMTRPQFKYFDGQAWHDQWSSVERQGLPHAVAVCFDFPAPGEFQRPERSRSSNSLNESDSLVEAVPVGSAPLANAIPSLGSGDLGQSDSARLVDSTDRSIVIAIETGERFASNGLAVPQSIASPSARVGTSSANAVPGGRRTSNAASMRQAGGTSP